MLCRYCGKPIQRSAHAGGYLHSSPLRERCSYPLTTSAAPDTCACGHLWRVHRQQDEPEWLLECGICHRSCVDE